MSAPPICVCLSNQVLTTCPAMQVYTGNFLNGSDGLGKNGVHHLKQASVCLETQVTL